MAYTPVYGPCFKVVMIKAMPYRDETVEEFSHGYTFPPAVKPNTETEWNAYITAIRGQELGIYTADVKFHRAYGYENNDPSTAHTWLTDWEALGTVASGAYQPVAGAVKGAGDQAAVVQWLHSVKSAKGKPLWFRKFHHHPYIVNGGGDGLDTDYKAKLQTYANYFQTYLGGQYSTKYPGGTSVNAVVPPYVTTRTLKHRGKRPRPA